MKITAEGTNFDDIPPAGRCAAGSVLLVWEKGVGLPRVCCPDDGRWSDASGWGPLAHGLSRWAIIEPTRPPVVRHLTSQLYSAMTKVEDARAQLAITEAMVDEVIRRDMALEAAAADPDMAIVVIGMTGGAVHRAVRVDRVTRTQIVTACGSRWLRKATRKGWTGDFHQRIGRGDGILTHVHPKWTEGSES